MHARHVVVIQSLSVHIDLSVPLYIYCEIQSLTPVLSPASALSPSSHRDLVRASGLAQFFFTKVNISRGNIFPRAFLGCYPLQTLWGACSTIGFGLGVYFWLVIKEIGIAHFRDWITTWCMHASREPSASYVLYGHARRLPPSSSGPILSTRCLSVHVGLLVRWSYKSTPCVLLISHGRSMSVCRSGSSQCSLPVVYQPRLG
jgi:hypothetical protein